MGAAVASSTTKSLPKPCIFVNFSRIVLGRAAKSVVAFIGRIYRQ
jgi:hypothetical protein